MIDKGKLFLNSIKNFAGENGPQLVLRVIGFEQFFLRPIPTRFDLISKRDVRILTDWRNSYPKSFLTEFDADNARTSTWLSEFVHKDEGRILFMLENRAMEPLGYMGIAYIDWQQSYFEADAIVSGGSTPKGLMHSSLITLILWAKAQLGLREVGVRVLSDNRAITFYQQAGFIEIRRVPLRREVHAQGISWVEDGQLNDYQRELVHHIWRPSQQLLSKFLI
jgi:hypothetical protein